VPSVTSLIGRMERAVGERDRVRDELDADKYHTDDWKRPKLDEAQSQAEDRHFDALTGLWGDCSDPTKEPQGGECWSSVEKAEKRLFDAKSTADGLDAARVRNSYERVPGLVAGVRNLGELGAAYDTWDAYDKRGLQDLGPSMLRSGRFATAPDLGAFLSRLSGDRSQSLMTDAVKKAQADLDAAKWQRVDAVQASRELTKRLAPRFRKFDIDKVLSSFEATYKVDPTGESETVWTIRKRGPKVVIPKPKVFDKTD
jgi:hypothetical protein